jgi:YD repeat-containing protein
MRFSKTLLSKIIVVLLLIILSTPAQAASYTYTYDALGRLKSADNLNHNIQYNYDEAGNMISVGVNSQAPTTPTNLTATPNGLTQVDLTWSPSTDTAGVAGYKIERSTDGISYSQIATSLNNNYSDASVTAQDIYYYRVRAYDEAGSNSGYSNVAQASVLPTLRYEESSSDILYESSPEVDSWDWQTHKDSELSGQFEKYTYTQGNSFTLTFTGTSVSLISTKGPNKGIAEIYVDGEYEQDVDLYSPTIDIYQAPVYTNDNLLLGVHSIKVVCSGQKNFAADDCAVGIDYFDVVGIADTQAPGAPTNLAGTTTETDTVSLCWGPAIDNVAVTGYSIERSTDGSSYEQIATVAPRTFNYTDQTAISGTSYFYCIRAYDAAANVSSASNILQTDATVATRFEEHAPEIEYNDGQWWDFNCYFFSGDNAYTSYSASDTATFTFTGTSVTWISDRNQYQGTAIVSIDNDAPQIIDSNVDITDGAIFGPLYTKSGLSAGTHTLKIVVTGEQRLHTWDTWVDIDAFDVVGG